MSDIESQAHGTKTCSALSDEQGTVVLEKNGNRSASTGSLAGSDISKVLDEGVTDESTATRSVSSTLCPTDQLGGDDFIEGGLQGWKVVLGCALVSIPTIGWALVWGVFQKYHSEHYLPHTPTASLSAIISVSNALASGLGFISGKLGDRYGYKRFIAAGCTVVFLGQFCAAFCHQYWSILLTQGIMNGIGEGLLVTIIISLPSQWFGKRRGIATGIVAGTSSLGGSISSVVLEALLPRIGFRKTMLIFSCVQAIIMLSGFLLIETRPRADAGAKHESIVWFDKKYFKQGVFWSYWITLAFVMAGYKSPFVFISMYTAAKLPHISTQLAVLPMTVMTFTSIVGRLAAGLIADWIGPINTLMLFTFFSAFCQAVLWNVAAETYAGIMVLSVLLGLVGPSFVSLTAPVAASLYGTHNLANVTGLFYLALVPGSLAGPIIAGQILDSSGHNWHALAAYSGLLGFVAVLCMLYARFKRNRNVFARV